MQTPPVSDRPSVILIKPAFNGFGINATMPHIAITHITHIHLSRDHFCNRTTDTNLPV